MKLTDEIEKLQNENPGKIILVKNGIFFIAIGKDAVILNKQIDLKATCLKNEVCKVGFQVKSIDKFLRKFEDKKIPVIIYTNEDDKLEEIYRNKFEKIEIEEKSNIGCENCGKKKETEDDIIKRLKEMGK